MTPKERSIQDSEDRGNIFGPSGRGNSHPECEDYPVFTCKSAFRRIAARASPHLQTHLYDSLIPAAIGAAITTIILGFTHALLTLARLDYE
jgi:hypothetical protein